MTFLLCCLLTPPLGPAENAPFFQLEQLVNEKGEGEASGYVVLLSRPAAEALADVLHELVDEEAIAKALEANLKDLKTRLFILVAKQSWKRLKSDLREKLGAEGVRITVKGMRPLDLLVKDRTEEDREEAKRRERLIQALLPRKLKAAHSMINTVPTTFTVEPRGERLLPVQKPTEKADPPAHSS